MSDSPQDINSAKTGPRPYFKLIVGCLALAGLLALSGAYAWLAGQWQWASFDARWIPMAPSTALAIAALALALGLRLRSRQANAWHYPAASLAWLTTALTGFLLLKFALFPGLDIERFLLTVPGRMHGVPIGRMSPLTALCLFFLGLALVRRDSKLGGKPLTHGLCTGLSLAAGLIGFLIVVGYAHKAPLLYGGRVIPVAFSTGLAISFLGIAGVCLYGTCGWCSRFLLGPSLGARLVRVFVPLVAFLILLFGVTDTWLDYLPPLQKDLWHGIFVLALLGVGTVPVLLLSRHFEADLQRAQAGQREAEEALRESEKKYRSLFESAGDAILVMDEDGVRSCNHFTLALFGCSESDLLGHSLLDFSPPLQSDGLRSEEKAAEYFQRAIKGEPQRFEWIYMRATGKRFDAAVTLTRFETDGPPCVQGILRDITAEKKTREALRHERDLITQIMETSPAAIFVTDRARRIKFANRRAEQILGLTRDTKRQGFYDAPDWRFAELDGTPLADEDRPTSRILTTGESVLHRRLTVSWPVNHKVALSVNAAPLVGMNDDVEGCVVSVADITEVIQRAQDRQRLEEETMRRMELERLTRLLQGLAHEVRNPLFALNVNVELIKKQLERDSEIADPLRRVIQQTRRLDALVSLLLELSHPLLPQERRAISLQDFFSTVRAAVETEDAGAAERLRFQLPKESLTLDCVPEKLGKALKHIVLNALQNSPAPAPVTLKAEAKVGAILIEIADEGPGLPPKLEEGLFEPFVTSHQGRRGLGLTIAKHYVDAHGGTIVADNRPSGPGARFTVRLPLSRSVVTPKKEVG